MGNMQIPTRWRVSKTVRKMQLNERQKHLLQSLVRCHQDDLLFDVIRPIPTGPDTYVLYLRGKHNMTLTHISDLDVLCVHGFLDFDFSRFGNQKVFALSEKALALSDDLSDLVDDDFLIQKLKQQLVQTVSGETLTAALIELDFVKHHYAAERNDQETAALYRALAQLTTLATHQLPTNQNPAPVAATLALLTQLIAAIP